jgi:hypothetical protein
MILSVPFAMAKTGGQSGTGVSLETRHQVQGAEALVKDIRSGAVQGILDAKHNLLEQNKILHENTQMQTEAVREELHNSLMLIQQNTDLTSDEARQAMLQVKEEAHITIQNRIEEVKQAMTVNREEFRNQIEERKLQAKELMQENRTMLQERLGAIKDEKKQEIVLNFTEKIGELNEKYMDHLTASLNNMETVLQGVMSRTEKASVDGKDVSSIRTAIAVVEEDIVVARSYIINQLATTYVVNVTDEDNLRDDVSLVRNEFRSDIQLVREAVLKVREDLSEVASLLGQIQGINNLEIEEKQ